MEDRQADEQQTSTFQIQEQKLNHRGAAKLQGVILLSTAVSLERG